MLTILLATYNGEKYLQAQLDSLLSQTFTEFKVWVQDDASTDSTWDILTQYKQRHTNKFEIVKRKKNSGSAKENFLDMMANVQDDYIMLCDQDDIWLPNKIELTMAKMRELEQKFPDMPLLVHTDLQVVDKDLNVISLSFKILTKRNYSRMEFRHVLTLNNVSGCTVLYNKALARYLTVSPKHCVMHDWWLQLVAKAFGQIGHINDATLLYRQHGENACGAKDVSKFLYKLNRLLNGKELRKVLHETCDQARCLLDIHHEKLTKQQQYILQEYSSIPSMGKFRRIKTIFKLRTFMPSISRNIALLLFI